VSSTFLLDANAVIALVIAEHEHHDRVSRWAAGVDTLALCPITEGAMVRYLVRSGETAATAMQLVRALRDSRKTDFWADSISYGDVSLDHVVGHRQATDAYLASLAASHAKQLATLDEGLAGSLPRYVFLIP
jgi:predicted nucleic acid-binding protein